LVIEKEFIKKYPIRNETHAVLAPVRIKMTKFTKNNAFEYLEYFANSSGIAKNLKIGKSYSVKDKYSVTKFNEFQGMYGRMIEEPYLKLESQNTSIGLGIKKAKISILIKKDIEAFVEKNGN
jgi:hypothetical protein